MDPDLWELLEEGDGEDEVAAIIRLAQRDAVPSKVHVIVRAGDIITVRMPRREILNIRNDKQVASVKASGHRGDRMLPDLEIDDSDLLQDLDESVERSDERRPPLLEATGRGVVMGFVGWGFDPCHPDFRNPDGSTRILALWDQRSKPNLESPQPYGYGVVHTCEEINRALVSPDPYAALDYYAADSDRGHGAHETLVVGIAAGNGRGGGPLGIAPETEFVCVHHAPWQRDLSEDLGESATLVEAIAYIFSVAGDRPCVINLSMGNTNGPHDWTPLVVQAMDAMLQEAPGRVICQSTGNYFAQRLHSSGQLRPTEERSLTWMIPRADVTSNELEIWYSGRDKIEVVIFSPDGAMAARLKPGERVSLIANSQTIGTGYNREAEPNSLDKEIKIILYPGAPAGDWKVTLIGMDIVDGRFHAWIGRDANPHYQSRLREEDADPTSTTGNICNGLRTIVVGAYNSLHPDQPVAIFSSVGKTRDGRVKPDLCAPGVAICGARSAPRDANGQEPLYTRMSGTSFASPFVAGCVALMLQVAPRPLRIEEVHNLLLSNTRKISFPGELPDRVGSGYLDIEMAVEAARNIAGVGPELKLMSQVQEDAMNQDDQELTAEALPNRANYLLEEAFDSFEETEDYQAQERATVDLIELADQVIAEGTVTLAPSVLLSKVLTRAGIAEGLILPGSTRILSAAEIFDAYVYPGREVVRNYLDQYLEVVALPRSRLGAKIYRGCVMLRRGEGSLAHLAILATGEMFTREELVARGARPESNRPGLYSVVIEAGARPHHSKYQFARLVSQDNGWLDQDTMVLCIRPNVLDSVQPIFSEYSEDAAAPRRHQKPSAPTRKITMDEARIYQVPAGWFILIDPKYDQLYRSWSLGHLYKIPGFGGAPNSTAEFIVKEFCDLLVDQKRWQDGIGYLSKIKGDKALHKVTDALELMRKLIRGTTGDRLSGVIKEYIKAIREFNESQNKVEEKRYLAIAATEAIKQAKADVEKQTTTRKIAELERKIKDEKERADTIAKWVTKITETAVELALDRKKWVEAAAKAGLYLGERVIGALVSDDILAKLNKDLEQAKEELKHIEDEKLLAVMNEAESILEARRHSLKAAVEENMLMFELVAMSQNRLVTLLQERGETKGVAEAIIERRKVLGQLTYVPLMITQFREKEAQLKPRIVSLGREYNKVFEQAYHELTSKNPTVSQYLADHPEAVDHLRKVASAANHNATQLLSYIRWLDLRWSQASSMLSDLDKIKAGIRADYDRIITFLTNLLTVPVT